MRGWYKYIPSDQVQGTVRVPVSESLEDHEWDLRRVPGWTGGRLDQIWEEEEAKFYVDKDTFFEHYFFDEARSSNYHAFIRMQVSQEEDLLSIGSERCANELMLAMDGYDIVCSDLGRPSYLAATEKLFPALRHTELDIISSYSAKQHDAVLSLSVIYVFDSEQLRKFFDNVNRSLKPGGHLILDSSGPPDNLLASLINDVLLRLEAEFIRLIAPLKRKTRRGMIIKHHGYRRSDDEILKSARDAGFDLEYRENYDFLTEFERSFIIHRILGTLPWAKGLFQWLGRAISYTRMYDLKKL